MKQKKSRGLRITGLVIMRDAAADIEPCLMSMKGQVDELVAVDTGSVDDTVAIAKRCGAKVLSYEWQDDFAAARNFAIDQVTGDWIVFLDSDEAFTEETRGNLRMLVGNLVKHGRDCAFVRRENVDGEDKPIEFMGDFSIRIFRRTEGLRYFDPVHEYLAWEDGHEMESGILVPEELCIRHRGYAPDRIKGKRLRDLDILERMQEKKPGQKKLYKDFYLSALYKNLGQPEKAMEHVRAAFESGDMPSFRTVDVWRTWMDCMRDMDDIQGLDEAIAFGLDHYLYAPDPYIQAGVRQMSLGHYDKAFSLVLLGMSFIDSFGRLRPMEENAMALFRPKLFATMSQIYYGLGRMEDARRMASLSGKGNDAAGENGEDMLEFSDFLPPRAKRVLHFGCGEARTARRFRQIQPECRYVGVVEEKGQADAARPWLSEVFIGRPGAEGFRVLGFDEVDCIIYEGYSVPLLTKEILQEQASHLAPRGQMIVVADNPGYLGRLLETLSGKTQESAFAVDIDALCTMAEEAGLAVDRIRPVMVPEDGEEMERPETKALQQAVLSWQEAKGVRFRNPWARQFLLRLTRKVQTPPVFVTAWLGEALVTARVRLSEPHAFLITEPGIQYHAETKGLDVGHGRGYAQKIALRQRIHYKDAGEAFRQIGELRQRGYLLLYELDDNPSRWGEDHERSLWLDFRGSHACQVSTPALAEVLRHYNPHVKVFRNELRELPPKREYVPKAPVTIFFGALNREEDWRDIMPVLNEAAEKYGEDLRFRVLADKEFFGALQTEYKEFIGDSRYYNGKYVPYSVYSEVLHTADISLLPLRDTAFNRTKSDLKFIESAGHGAVVLASPTVYSATVRDGETGFLYRDSREFAQRLRLLIEDRSRRLELAEAAYSYVRSERLLSQHYEERMDWYRELFARREELERDLEERLAAVMAEQGKRGGA